MTQIYQDGSYNCVDIDSVSDSEPAPEGLSETLEANNTANQSIDLKGNNISNFFDQNACSTGSVVKTVYPNGSYECVSVDSVSSVENLSETLEAGNLAGEYSINLSSNSLYRVDNITFNSSVLLGEGSSGNDWKDVVIGSGSAATAPSPTPKFGETAVGYNSTVGGYGSAFGSNSGASVGGVAIGHNTSAGQVAVAVGSLSNSTNAALALGPESSATGFYSSAIGSQASASKKGAVAIGYGADAPNKYEATFGNLGAERLDVNVTGNLTVHGQNLDLSNGSMINFFNQTQCASDRAVKRIYENGSYECTAVAESGISDVARSSGLNFTVVDWETEVYDTDYVEESLGYDTDSHHITFDVLTDFEGNFSARAMNTTQGFNTSGEVKLWNTTNNGRNVDQVIYNTSIEEDDKWAKFVDVNLTKGEIYRIEHPDGSYISNENKLKGIYTEVIGSHTTMNSFDIEDDTGLPHLAGFSAFKFSPENPFVMKSGDTMLGNLSLNGYNLQEVDKLDVNEINPTGDKLTTGGGLEVQGSGGLNLTNSSARIGFTNSGIRIGSNSKVSKTDGLAIGKDASTSQGTAIGKGALSEAGGSLATAVGTSSKASKPYAMAYGSYSKAKAGQSVAIGGFSKASGKGSVAIGYSAEAPNEDEVVFGVTDEDLYRLDVNISGNATVHGQKLDMRNGSITNFFNQSQCRNNYVVSGIYDNGSYECTSASSAVAAQTLETTLESGSSAGPYSIDMNDNSINNIYSVSGTDGSVRFNSDLDLGDNQLVVGNSSISGGLKIGSDINLQGNDLRQIGFINPSGASTNFGGDLNVGNDRLVSVDNMEFSRGIEIGGKDTYTGQPNVAPPSNFTVDTKQEWQDNGTINSNLNIDGTNLELGVSGDKADWVWNSSTNGNGNAIDVENGNLYVAAENEVAKYDSTGGKVWSKSLSRSGNGIDVIDSEVFVVTQGNELIKFSDQGGSSIKEWNKSLTGSGRAVTVEGEEIYVTTNSPKLEKYVDNGDNASKVWNTSIRSESEGDGGSDVAAQNQSVYAFSAGEVIAFEDNGSAVNKRWQDPLSYSVTYSGYVSVEGDNVYVADVFDGLYKLKDEGSSATHVWDIDPSPPLSEITIENGEIYGVSGSNEYNGDVKDRLFKYVDKGNSVSLQFKKSLSGNGNDVAVTEDEIYTVSDADNLAKFENLVTYHESGSYTSDVFDTGSVNSFPDFEVSSFLPSGTEANISVELSNSSDMSGSFIRELEVGGGTESSLLGRSARYARFNVDLAGDSTDTPELDRFTINYGNAAAAYGYNQIALGRSATTDAPGAVAIGHNASSNESYTVRFGNSQGQELDVDVTGNLSVDGSAALGNNTNSGLGEGDINASDIYYDTLTAKSPVVQCSAGSDWCKVDVPENQSSFFVKKSENFDKERPRETAEEVVESDVETVKQLEALREENRRQDERIEDLEETISGLKAVVCEENPGAEVCS